VFASGSAKELPSVPMACHDRYIKRLVLCGSNGASARRKVQK